MYTDTGMLLNDNGELFAFCSGERGSEGEKRPLVDY